MNGDEETIADLIVDFEPRDEEPESGLDASFDEEGAPF